MLNTTADVVALIYVVIGLGMPIIAGVLIASMWNNED